MKHTAEVVEKGKIGKLEYRVICVHGTHDDESESEISENFNNYSVELNDGKHKWQAVYNTGHVAVWAYVQGLKAGRSCKNVEQMAKKGFGYSEYGGEPYTLITDDYGKETNDES